MIGAQGVDRDQNDARPRRVLSFRRLRPAPSQPLDAKSFDAMQRDLRGKLDEGIITNAQFSQASQRLELATYMKFSWPDAKGVPQPRLRIPVTRAMEAMVAESGPKGADAGKGGGAK